LPRLRPLSPGDGDAPPAGELVDLLPHLWPHSLEGRAVTAVDWLLLVLVVALIVAATAAGNRG